MPNDGASTPVKDYGEPGKPKILPNSGAGRIGKIRPKGGKTIADLIKGV